MSNSEQNNINYGQPKKKSNSFLKGLIILLVLLILASGYLIVLKPAIDKSRKEREEEKKLKEAYEYVETEREKRMEESPEFAEKVYIIDDEGVCMRVRDAIRSAARSYDVKEDPSFNDYSSSTPIKLEDLIDEFGEAFEKKFFEELDYDTVEEIKNDLQASGTSPDSDIMVIYDSGNVLVFIPGTDASGNFANNLLPNSTDKEKSCIYYGDVELYY